MGLASLFLVGILVFLAANVAEVVVCYDIGGGGGSGGVVMDEEELFGLFEVMGSLLEDPSWAQMHPFPCTETPWPGVECELLEQTSIFHVTKIHIGPDVLTPPCKASAKLPHSLLKLPYLKILSLISCFTKSPVSLPKSLFGPNLPYLEHLSLESNPSLTGEIPSSISNLGNLKILCMSENNLTGQIPDEIGGLLNLRQLVLSRNNLTGPIPEEIGLLRNLAILDLGWNGLQGNVPGSIGGLTSLEKIDLSSNKLQGDLPQELGNVKSLTLLDLSHNALTGQIPDSLSGLPQLQYLIMDGNPLNASLPVFVGSLFKLAVLSFSGCGLTGPIPAIFSNLTNLTDLSLDNNSLNGTVPAELGLLPSLDMLNLSRNQLSGELLFPRDVIDRLGERLDFRGNDGLCINYGDGGMRNGGSRLLRNPVCSTKETSAADENMKPKVYKDDESSSADGLDRMLLVLFLGLIMFV